MHISADRYSMSASVGILLGADFCPPPGNVMTLLVS